MALVVNNMKKGNNSRLIEKIFVEIYFNYFISILRDKWNL
tara:strand:+ start:108 stop:227 length:120 start_codon:yes stop_codon:yes gene_type:complete